MSIPPRPFYFLRHGQTDWNVEKRLQGHTDIPLNATGLQQAHAAALKLKSLPITRIVSSPLTRALKTAAVAAEALNLPLHIDSTLMERTFGSIEGRLTSEILHERGLDPADIDTDFMPADGEQWPQTMFRARFTITQWLNQYPDDTLLFVGHGAFFRALHEVLTGHKLHANNATPYHFTPTENGQWHMRTI